MLSVLVTGTGGLVRGSGNVLAFESAVDKVSPIANSNADPANGAVYGRVCDIVESLDDDATIRSARRETIRGISCLLAMCLLADAEKVSLAQLDTL